MKISATETRNSKLGRVAVVGCLGRGAAFLQGMRTFLLLSWFAFVCVASAQDTSLPPAQLLRSALDYTRTAKGMRIKATVDGETKRTLEAQVAGQDFDLQIAPGAKRLRSVGASNWTSSDGGKTWQPSEKRDAAELSLLLDPLVAPKGQPEVEKAGEETSSNGKEQERLVLLKVKAGNATAEYWIGWSQTKKPLVRRFKGLAPGSTSAWVDARYSWINATPAVEKPAQ